MDARKNETLRDGKTGLRAMLQRAARLIAGIARPKPLAGVGILCLLFAVQSSVVKADGLTGITLSGTTATGDFFFAPGASSGDLSMTVTGCSNGQPGCTNDSGITGSTTIGGTAFTWQLLPVSASFTPCQGTAGCWNFSAITTGTADLLIDPTNNPLDQLGSGGGVVNWSSLTEMGGVNVLSGTAIGTDPTGSPFDDPFSVTLGALSCFDSSTSAPATPCSLAAISTSDPIYGIASFGSGQFGSGSGTPPAETPEPSTILLFGSGLLGLAALARRRATSLSTPRAARLC